MFSSLLRRASLVVPLGLLALSAACTPAAEEARPIIGLVQISSVAPLDASREGFYRALADSGFVRDVNVTILERNAQGDVPALSLIMSEFRQERVTHVVTLSSVATQAALKAFEDRPIIFGAVANPYVIGAGSSPTVHRPNVTGAQIVLPVDSTFALATQLFPAIKVWGTLFDPSDPFAEYYLDMTRRVAASLGVRLEAVACTSPSDIASAAQAVRAAGAEGIVQIPSVMIGGGFPSLVKTARELGIPLINTTTGYDGAVVSMGASFADGGYDAGLQLIRVLRGEDPAKMPFLASDKRVIEVDLGAAAAIGFSVPPAVLARAARVIPASGGAGASVGGTPAGPSGSQAPSPLTFWFAALTQGLAYVALAWGVFISSRVLRFPDITPDGSFPLGAAVGAAAVLAGVHPLVALVAAFVTGMAAGYITALLHTRLGVTELLAGILVMTGLYSVNLRVMGRSNLSLLDKDSIVLRLHGILPMSRNWSDDLAFGAIFMVLLLGLGLVLTWFLRTDLGMAMRATGDNPAMVAAQGVDRKRMVELGLSLANGLTALSGALIAQYQSFADVGMGVGTLVAGMAAVILGETLRPRRWGLGATIVMVAVGAVAFRGLIALALRAGLDPIDLKLATAAFVLLALTLPRFRSLIAFPGRAR